ncbi:uncharacterized protein BP5553_05657 [Venustampulla echinocandica]|uniref:Uncharacterized protein n=1 Tax=Venustampulla echinocandica TaxID=2656787 RepID=A0A370TLB0_9HELO|nr:uncharacterized protein BP5553_05657 [Venustampulla echinocandica]RDL36305.1 hypothetical protein BP5553_05657 [Venustampulla echinocandica]
MLIFGYSKGYSSLQASSFLNSPSTYDSKQSAQENWRSYLPRRSSLGIKRQIPSTTKMPDAIRNPKLPGAIASQCRPHSTTSYQPLSLEKARAPNHTNTAQVLRDEPLSANTHLNAQRATPSAKEGGYSIQSILGVAGIHDEVPTAAGTAKKQGQMTGSGSQVVVRVARSRNAPKRGLAQDTRGGVQSQRPRKSVRAPAGKVISVDFCLASRACCHLSTRSHNLKTMAIVKPSAFWSPTHRPFKVLTSLISTHPPAVCATFAINIAARCRNQIACIWLNPKGLNTYFNTGFRADDDNISPSKSHSADGRTSRTRGLNIDKQLACLTLISPEPLDTASGKDRPSATSNLTTNEHYPY